MRFLDLIRLRLRSLFRRERLDSDLDEEMQFHLEELTKQGMNRGLTRDEARVEALKEFGAVAQLQEGCRDSRGTRWIEEFVTDLRHAVRLSVKSPGFTGVALLSLALGIGANTAIFTLVETVMLRTLPVRSPDELVQIIGVVPGKEAAQESVSYLNFQWLRDHTPMFSTLLTWRSRKLEAGEGENMEWVAVDGVSAEYFSGLGVAPLIGRTLAEERQNLAVAVLSYNWWRNRFQSDSAVLGRTVRLGGLSFTIVGVAPEGFFGPNVGASPDVFIPLEAETVLDPANGARNLFERNSSFLPVLARLSPGVTIDQAAAGLQPLWTGMVQETGPLDRQGQIVDWFRVLKSEIRPASTGISNHRRRFRQPLAILLVVVGVVLLIACVNLSNFLMARAIARQREVALRLALGASRARVIRQLLTENFLLAAGGAALGLMLAIWSAGLLTSLLSNNRGTINLDVRLNGTLFGYTAGITLLTTLLFGLAPAIRALRPSYGRMRTSSRALLVVQVALSLLLISAAGLFLRTFQGLLSVELGFDAGRVLVASVEPARTGLKEDTVAQFYRDLQSRLQTLPGVESVSFATGTPIQNCCWWDTMTVQGYTPAPNEKVSTYLNSVAPGFHRTLGTRFLRGRDFDARDTYNGTRVAIVNEAFAKKYFPGGQALGRIISLPPNYKAGPMQIVGIVEDARYLDLRGPTRLAAYFPLAQSSDRLGLVEVLVRTPGSPLALAPAVRQQIHSFYPAMPVRFRSLAQEVDGVLTYERLLALISGFFGAVALLLAAIGLYGIVSYSVTQRTREIGVRVALGASRVDVIWMMMRQSLASVAAGLIIGCAAAVYLTRFVKTLLFGVGPTDPAAFAAAAGILGAVTVFAAWLPARRAAAVDPMRALRYE